MEIILDKQSNFPLLDKYKDKFPVTKNTIFAHKNTIYTNYNLPAHLIIHEATHLKQQNKIEVDQWHEWYLNDDRFRLEVEIEAYQEQINSVKDRNDRAKLRLECVNNLSSPLYGSIISKEEALKKLTLK